MLPQLHLIALPTAISIAFFDASSPTRKIALGVIAGAVGGIYVLVDVVWRGWGRAPAGDQVA